MMEPSAAWLNGVKWEVLEVDALAEGDLPYATHRGIAKIGPLEMEVFQLNTGQRVISEAGVAAFLNFLQEDHSPGSGP